MLIGILCCSRWSVNWSDKGCCSQQYWFAFLHYLSINQSQLSIGSRDQWLTNQSSSLTLHIFTSKYCSKRNFSLSSTSTFIFSISHEHILFDFHKNYFLQSQHDGQGSQGNWKVFFSFFELLNNQNYLVTTWSSSSWVSFLHLTFFPPEQDVWWRNW